MAIAPASDPLPIKPGNTPGFLLTRHWQDRPAGVELQYWVSTPEGPARLVFPGQEVVFFIAAAQSERALRLIASELHRHRNLDMRTFSGDAAVACYFRSQRSLGRARRLLQAAGIGVMEGDLRPAERFLMERFIHGSVEIAGTPLRDAAGIRYQAPKLLPLQWLPVLDVVSLDIETAIDRLALFSIGIVTGDTQLVFMVGDSADENGIRYFLDERRLLVAFIQWFTERDPDLVIGWNVINFDFWYLQRLCDRHRLPFAIGRAGTVPYWRPLDEGGNRQYCEVPGRVILDGIEVVKAAQYRLESYSLQYVAAHLIGEGKLLQGSGRGEQIEQLFLTDKPALAAYNLQDCVLVWQIFEQRKLLDFCIARSQLTGLALGRVGGSVAAFDFSYLPRLHREGFVAPAGLPAEEMRASPGGYVLDSRPGIYKNVLVFDFKSLYPSIIRSFCIDPMGMAIAALERHEATIEGFREASFSRHRHLLPGLLEELWQARDRARQQDDGALSQAIKILMNSFYGVLGSPGCRFFDPRLASSITMRGHEIIRLSRAFIEERGHAVIYGDTDSLFVWLEQEQQEEQVLALGRQLAGELNQWWRQRLQDEMDLASQLEVEFETHFLQFLMPTIRGTEKGSKKRYAGTVRKVPGNPDSGVELVFKGLETVRSDWTQLARRFQQELYRRVFAGQVIEAYVREVRQALMAGEHDDELVYRKRLRQDLDAYVKNVPPHVQAARKAIDAGARPDSFQRGRAVEYVITVTGPQAVGFVTQAYDYDHYAERQLAPVADGILFFFNSSFADIVDGQIALF